MPFSPSDLSGLRLWLKADQVTASDGDHLTTWADQSGNGFDGTGAGTTNPTYKTAQTAVGGPAILFAGANKERFVFGNVMASAAAGEIFLVVKAPASGDGGGPAAFGGTGAEEAYYPFGSTVYETSGGSRHSFTPSLDIRSAFRKLDVWRDGTTHAVLLDGVSQLSTSSGTVSWKTAPGIGAGFDPFSGGGTYTDGFGGTIAEVIVYDRVLNSTERADVLAYLDRHFPVIVVLAPAGAEDIAGTAELSVTRNLAPAGAEDISGAASLYASVALAAAGAEDTAGAAVLSVIRLLPAAGAEDISGSTTLTVTRNLHPTGAEDIAGSARLTGGTPVYPGVSPQLIEVRLYDETGLGDYTILDQAVDVGWRHELSRLGTGSFSVPAGTADQVTPRRIVKFAWQGAERFAIRITDDSCKAAVDGTRMVTVSGPGLLSLAGDAVVWPEYGLARASGGERRFGYMSQAGAWYVDSQWNSLRLVTAWTDYDRYPVYPAEWPDPQATWLSVFNATLYSWFRGTFTTLEEIPQARLAFCADDDCEVYLDGELLLTVQGDATVLNSTYTADVTPLPAGDHVLACRVTDAHKWPGEGAMGEVICSLLEVPDQSGVAPGEPVYGDVIFRSSGSWKALTDLDGTAGWARGQVLVKLLEEAEDRGVEGATLLSWDFDDTTDSDGQPWAGVGDFSFPAVSTRVDQAVEQLSEADIDVDVDPETMTVRAWNRRGADLTGAVVLALAENLAEYDTSRTSNVVTELVGHLADGTWVEAADAAGQALWGRVERGVELGSTASHSTGLDVAAGVFASTADEQLALTARPGALEGAIPYVDYDLGDTITVPGHRGIGTIPARVLAINVAQDGESVSAWPELVHDPVTGAVDETPDGPPGAPRGVHVTTPGTASSGTATLHWTVPDDGGQPITGYTITLDGTHDPLPTPGAGDTSASLTGLDDDTLYAGTIRAANALGAGAVASFSFTSDSATPPAPPPPPPAGIIFGINVDSGGGGPYTSIATRTAQYVSWPACRGPYYKQNMPAAFPRAQMEALSPSGIWQVSFKYPPADVIAGAIDSKIQAWIGALQAGEILYFTEGHEPNKELAGGQYAAAQFKDAQYHLAGLIDSTPCDGTAICMPCYTAPPNASWSDTWLVDVAQMGSRSILSWDKYGNPPPAIGAAANTSAPYDGLIQTPAQTYSRMLQITDDYGWGSRWGVTEMNAPRRSADMSEAVRREWMADAVAYLSGGGGGLVDPPNHLMLWEGDGVQFDQNIYVQATRDLWSGWFGN